MQTITFRWISNEVLPNSTGNCVQSFVIDHGRQYEKKNVCVCVCVCIMYVYVYMYDWVTLLYSRNWHNIVNPLY